jgi:hypothetical protein
MDDQRFDDLVRGLASRSNRRALVSTFAGLAGLAAGLLGKRPAGAAESCPDQQEYRRDVGCVCRTTGRTPVDGSCPPPEPSGVGAVPGPACPHPWVKCDDLCCPPETIGCVVETGGSKAIGCLCPEGSTWDQKDNVCAPDGPGFAIACSDDKECDSGNCCGGSCCPAGKVCCGGHCVVFENCVCPPGTSCAADATCITYGATYSTAGTCCPYPYRSFCCGDSAPGAGNGAAGCCLLGVDCPWDAGSTCASNPLYASGGEIWYSCVVDPAGDCCLPDRHGDEVTAGPWECVLPGQPCNPSWPCCAGHCTVTGVCNCPATGVCGCKGLNQPCKIDAECCTGKCSSGPTPGQYVCTP